jgi:hypothetical protein
VVLSGLVLLANLVNLIFGIIPDFVLGEGPWGQCGVALLFIVVASGLLGARLFAEWMSEYGVFKK